MVIAESVGRRYPVTLGEFSLRVQHDLIAEAQAIANLGPAFAKGAHLHFDLPHPSVFEPKHVPLLTDAK